MVVVIDGPRFSETWGHPEQKYIPLMAGELAPEGTFFSNFRNEGLTNTNPGHTAIVTGRNQYMRNDGSEYPQGPSFFQHYLQQTGQSPDKAFIITSKTKLKILADSRHRDWRGRFTPSYSCGKNNEDRSDQETLEETYKTLREKKPNLMLVQFLGPDKNGHENNWPGYLESIQETDILVAKLWRFIQQDAIYKDKTALLITNDHGRHSDGQRNGFISHGDDCESCRHISLLALGPDFDRGIIVSEHYDQTAIAPTIAQLLGFRFPSGEGNPIQPLLKNIQ